MATTYTVQGTTFRFKDGVNHDDAMNFIHNYMDGNKAIEQGADAPLDHLPQAVQNEMPSQQKVLAAAAGEDVSPEKSSYAGKFWNSFKQQAMAKAVAGAVDYHTQNPLPMLMDVVGGINKGILNLADLPVDMLNLVGGAMGVPAYKPPSDFLDDIMLPDGTSMKDTLGRTGYAGDKGKFIGRVAEEVAFAGTGASLAMSGAKAIYEANRLRAPFNSSTNMLKNFTSNPQRFLAEEMKMGLGAGVGAATAQQVFPESQLAEAGGALVGGLGPQALAPTAAFAWRKIKEQTTDPFTEAGVRERVSNFLVERSSDPEQAVKSIKANKALVETFLGTSKNVSSDVLSEDAGLMQAVNSLSASDTKLLGMLNRMEQNAKASLDPKMVQAVPEGDPRDTIDFMADRVQKATEKYDGYLSVLEQQIDTRLRSLVDDTPSEDLSVEFFDKVKEGMKSARETESKLWQEIEGKSLVSMKELKKGANKLKKSIPKTMKADNIPTEEFGLISKLSKEDKVQNVLTLRSQVLEGSRKARAAGDYTKARILGDMEGILNDFIDSTGSLGEDYRRAADFSRMLHDRYTRGSIGKVLGYDTAGAEKINPEEVLRTLVKQNEKGAANANDINALIGGIPGFEDVTGLKEIQEPLYNYIRQGYLAAGNNPTKQYEFMEKYSPLLRKFPTLQRQLVNETRNVERMAARMAEVEGRKATVVDKGLSKLAARMGTDPTRVAERMSRMDTPELRQTLVLLKDDPAALNGARAAVSELLIQRMLMGRGGVPSLTPVLRDRKFRQLYENVLEPHQREFFTQLDKTSKVLFQTRPNAQGQIKLEMPLAAGLMQRVMGSGLATKAAGKLGINSGLIAAQQGSNFSRKFFESISDAKATKLLERAATDPDLMMDLLSPTLAKNPKEAQARMRLHLLNLGFNSFEDDEEE